MGHILRRRGIAGDGASVVRVPVNGGRRRRCAGGRRQRGSVWEAARLGVRGRQRRRAHSRVARVWAAGLFPFRAVGERGRGGVYSEGFFFRFTSTPCYGWKDPKAE